MVRTIERVMGQSLERRKLDGFEVELNAESRPAAVKNDSSRLKQQPGQQKTNPRQPRTFNNRPRSHAPSRS